MLPTPASYASDRGGVAPRSDLRSQNSGKPQPRKGETILLVDDDSPQCETMRACLAILGFVVIPCSDAEHACQTFLSSTIDLLLTDLQMPGRSGLELARELTRLRPALPVIIVSGSIPSEELMTEIGNHHWNFVAKPCNLAQLLGMIHASLAPAGIYAA